jgi:hypothetical protein
MTNGAEYSGGKQRGRPFAPGKSGNPAGKPRGARHAALVALDAIGEQGATDALHAVVGAAACGDLRAAEILLSRVWPVRKGRPVVLDLPTMKSAADLPTALAAVTEAVAAGDLTPDEGQAVAAVLEAQRRAIATAELEARVAALEARGGTP